MKTIAIIAGKGGVGKTTLALHLAVAAENADKATVLLDLDPQASAAAWKGSRKAEIPEVIALPATRLASTLQTATDEGFDLALIDTAPSTELTAHAAMIEAGFRKPHQPDPQPGLIRLRRAWKTATEEERALFWSEIGEA